MIATSPAGEVDVLCDETYAGRLSAGARFVFAYDPRTQPSQAVSLTMPVRPQPYEFPTLHPIFQMNLPEGFLLERLKARLAKTTGVDPMLLLPLFGGPEAVGRLRYAAPGRGDADAARASGERLADLLAHRGAEGLFERLVETYLLRSGLSGVQPKVLVPERPDGFAAPASKAAAVTSDLIVKSGLGEYPGLAVNEFVCMAIVEAASIPVSRFHLSEDGDMFVMHRFDRTPDGASLGFEDMAVLSAKPADRKYEGRYEDIARLVRAFCSPDHVSASLAQLFDMVALSCMLGNGGAHLKNFGLLYSDPTVEDVRLAPAFDIVNTTCYLPDDALALSLSGHRSFFAARLGLLEFARRCDLSEKRARARVTGLAEVATEVLAAHRVLAEAVPGFVAALESGIAAFRVAFAPGAK